MIAQEVTESNLLSIGTTHGQGLRRSGCLLPPCSYSKQQFHYNQVASRQHVTNLEQASRIMRLEFPLPDVDEETYKASNLPMLSSIILHKASFYEPFYT